MQDDEQAIRQLVATWLSASKAGDTEKVLSLMADDVVFLVPGQPPMRGRARLRRAKQGSSRSTSTRPARFKRLRCWESGPTSGRNSPSSSPPKKVERPSSAPATRCPSCKNRLVRG